MSKRKVVRGHKPARKSKPSIAIHNRRRKGGPEHPAGLRNCLKCSKPFKSWHVVLNRLCKKCGEDNSRVAKIVSACVARGGSGY